LASRTAHSQRSTRVDSTVVHHGLPTAVMPPEWG
jgi:hypothetical protein